MFNGYSFPQNLVLYGIDPWLMAFLLWQISPEKICYDMFHVDMYWYVLIHGHSMANIPRKDMFHVDMSWSMAIVWRISPEKICSRIFNRLWLLVLITVGAPSCDAFASGVLTGCKLESVPSMEILELGLYHGFLQQGGEVKLEQEHMIFSGDIRHTMAVDQDISTWNISFLGIFAILWPWINTYQYISTWNIS